MLSQEIIWTTLPHRVKDDHVFLSVLVSPRLGDTSQQDLKLGDFVDLLLWNETAPSLVFVVETDTGASLEVKPDMQGFDPEIWPLLFNEDTYVRSFNFTDLKERRIRSYPVRKVLQYLKNVYQTLGEESPSDLPMYSPVESINQTLDQLQGDLGDLTGKPYGAFNRNLDNLLSEIKALPPDEGVLGSAIPNPVQASFFQARRFYHRPEEAEPYLEAPNPSILAPPPPVEPPRLDFHQALALMSDHPPLLRRLGMIFDLAIPVAELGMKNQGKIRVRPLSESGFPQIAAHKDHTPWTRYLFTGERFLPEPAQDSDFQDGYLHLEGVNDRLEEEERPYDLVQVDADGLAIKTVHFAGTLSRLRARWDPLTTPIDEPARTGPPAIQTGGLALVRAHRAYRLHLHLLNAAAKNNQLPVSDPEFNAEELLRGYRVDIRDETEGRWRSLCAWQGSYEFSGAPIPPIAFGEVPGDDGQLEEGYVKSASVSSQEDTDPDLYFHETLLRWDGWSLVAPRPGRAIVRRADETTGEVDEHVDVVRNTAETEFGIAIHPEVRPGTLPRQRFGRTYQMRVRLVDLAGNSLPSDDPDDSAASEPVRFLRYEPLQPPVIVSRARFSEGESLERLVIRSDFDRSAGDYAADPVVLAALTGEAHTYTPVNERHVVPPKTSQVLAEMHGMFDPFFSPGQHQLGYNIALKEAGTLEDTQIVDTATGTPVSLPDPTSVEVVVSEPAPGEPPARHYVLHKEAKLLLPYLPDPIGRGAALQHLPDAAPGATPGLEMVEDAALKLNVLKVPFDMQWPDALPFRLVLAERPGKVDGDSCQETLENENDPPVWDAEARELTVHLPKASSATVLYSTYPGEQEETGQEDLELMGLWSWLEGSTKADELRFRARAGAHWMISPYRTLVLVHAVQRPLCAPRIDALAPLRKYGETFATLTGDFEISVKSTGKLDMHARWEQPVDDLNQAGPDVVSGESHAFEWPIEETFKDDLKATQKTGLRHEFGDTLHRFVRYRLTGTTRFREYFHPSITSDPANISRTGPEVEVHVPSSQRPAAPEVEYLLPTFKWEKEQELDENGDWLTAVRIRRGNGLRVYMQRPWYSSGADEKLGVVLWPFPSIFPIERYRNYVSLIGMDPVHRSNPPQGVLTPDDFSNKAVTDEWFSLQEVPLSVFRVAGFDVAYHQQRRLWYADIQFDSARQKSYYPFVRLALVRYQPWSIPGAHLSPITLSDFMQLTPDRTFVARWIDDLNVYIQVQGHAHTNRADNRMEVVIESPDPGIPGEAGWRQMSGTPAFQMTRSPIDLSNHLWKWEAVVSLPQARGSVRMRLLVKEFEMYADDSFDGKGERIVYADRLDL